MAKKQKEETLAKLTFSTRFTTDNLQKSKGHY